MSRTLVIGVFALCFPDLVSADDGYVREFENIAAVDEHQIGAYYYPWYDSDGTHWNEGVPRRPSLGEYSSSDAMTINRHIDWATGHGIDFFAVSWWGPDSFEDDVLQNSFLTANLAGEIGFAIMYESTGRLRMTDGRIDLDLPHNRDRLADDFRFLAETYFHEPTYLHIDGRPVVFVYLSRIMTGDVATAFDAIRSAVRDECGKDAFIIGDEVYWQEPSRERLELFDGVTAYNMHTSAPDVAEWFSQRLPEQYGEWNIACDAANVLFVPSAIPGFDDSAVRPEARHPVLPRSPELFEEQLRLALDTADEKQNLIMINSWNEWHEDTAIEPATDYELDYLLRLREVLTAP